MTTLNLIKILSPLRLPIEDEKKTQEKVEKALSENKVLFYREYRLDEKNTPDFLVVDKWTGIPVRTKGVAIELKIKGSRREIYRQCERYCAFDQVKELLLITNRSMGFPKEINGKPCYLLNIGKAWL
jgi:hypothetical protein